MRTKTTVRKLRPFILTAFFFLIAFALFSLAQIKRGNVNAIHAIKEGFYSGVIATLAMLLFAFVCLALSKAANEKPIIQSTKH